MQHELVATASALGQRMAEAIHQQAVGQVSAAVLQIDDITQQNAALVEQTTAATATLKEQAATLARLVRVFRIE